VNKWFWLTHYHGDQLLTSRYEHTCTSNQLLDSLHSQNKTYDGFVTSTKRSVEFQPSQWNSTKNNWNSNLSVRSQKFFRTHKSKKNGSSKIHFGTISCSHLASKLNLLRNSLPKATLQKLLKLLTFFNTSSEAHEGETDAKQPKLFASVFSLHLSWKHIFSLCTNILLLYKIHKCQPLTSAHTF